MEIDIEEFDQVNYAHLRDANNLIDRIIDENGYEYGIVLDVGCGSGNVTSLLDSRLHCKQIVAVDIDMKAIKYAQVQYPSSRVRYIEQDISLPWDELHPSIQTLEGKVELVFSNRVLHWIEDKRQTISNLYRLLRANSEGIKSNSEGCRGKLYANITTLFNLFRDSPQEERDKYEKMVKIPTEAEQMELFRKLFKLNRFNEVDIESTLLRQVYPYDEFRKIHLPYFPNLTKKYLIEKNPMKRNAIMSSGFAEVVKEAFLRLHCREIKSRNSQNQIDTEYEFTYGQIRIVAQK